MLFRGRERFFKERAADIFEGIIEEFGESIRVERPPGVEGRRMTMIVSPVKRKGGGGGQDKAARTQQQGSTEPRG